MKCPHCATGVYIDWYKVTFPIPSPDDEDDRGGYTIQYGFCPECEN